MNNGQPRRSFGFTSALKHKHRERLSHCNVCGAKLPCIACARAIRERSDEKGKEPTVDEADMALAPEVAARAAQIRNGTAEGFGGWTEAEHRRRAGLPLAIDWPHTTLPSSEE